MYEGLRCEMCQHTFSCGCFFLVLQGGGGGGFSLSRSGAPCDGALVSFLDKLIQREAAVLILTPCGPDFRTEKKNIRKIMTWPICHSGALRMMPVCQLGNTANAVHLACLP